MANLRGRIKRLEAIHGDLEGLTLTGVLHYHEGLIIVDGIVFTSIEDIPDGLRAKYPSLLAAKVTDEIGRIMDVSAPHGGRGVLLVPPSLDGAEWEAAAKAETNGKEI